jgi:hypothetical protein
LGELEVDFNSFTTTQVLIRGFIYNINKLMAKAHWQRITNLGEPDIQLNSNDASEIYSNTDKNISQKQ